MLSFLPGPLLFIINSLLIAFNVILIATPILLLGIVKILLPFDFIKKFVDNCNYYLYKIWVVDNRMLMSLTNDIRWHITGDEIPSTRKSCIVLSNHISWLDILFIGAVYGGRIPITKFFMKQNLIYIPFVGLACYTLGMPFLKRYPKEKLLKNPALRTKDVETTKKVCRELVKFPSSLINFCEGTRYTPEKAKKAKSTYRHLMPPKAASLGVALSEIYDEVEYIFNTTFYYPENSKGAFMDMMFGRIKNVYVNIEILEKNDRLRGNYLEDKTFKHDFTMYLRELWEKKDKIIDEMEADFRGLSQNKEK
ncbi:acetyltransferase [Succinivibrio dextrinosolvens]|uniref:acetyltransferase n=1 Tax=Succinivibrio dextrinosolvens TaxID=83771 RepID=UPI00056362C4|nr:acetyltransferase [Succinivibrio dextrinosolvens]